MKKIKDTKPILQVVAIPRVGAKIKHTNGEVKKVTNGRSFETRFVPRYTQIPAVPADLVQPSFSEASNKILKERYLLKGGNLEVVESVTERFWHIAYDIASGDFDFSPAPSGAGSKQVLGLAKEFYSMMVPTPRLS